MRRLLFLLSLISLVAIGCSNDEPTTVTAGDDTDAVFEDDDAMEEGVSDAVAKDSAPVGLDPNNQPTTTAPWEVTLKENPLLTLLDESANSTLGRANFVLVNQDGSPTFSGSDDHPVFLVGIEGFYSAASYSEFEFVVGTANVLLVDGQPGASQCESNGAWLSQRGDNEFLRISGELPEVAGSELLYSTEGCNEDQTVRFDSLFDVPVLIDVDADGFTLTPADGDGDPHYFAKIASPTIPDIAPTTTEVPATTEPQLQSPTTTGELDD